MAFVTKFDESAKLAAGMRYPKNAWDLYFKNTNEDFIFGYVEVAPAPNAMIIDDTPYLVISISDDDELIVSDMDGYVDIPNRYLFKMINGEIYDLEKRHFVKKQIVSDIELINKINSASTIDEFNLIKDDIINTFNRNLKWDKEGGEPGVDIRSYPNAYMTYVVRHLSTDRFDVILNIEGTNSIYFQENHTSYDQAKNFAQKDFEQRTFFNG